jgi:hypothetical protein
MVNGVIAFSVDAVITELAAARGPTVDFTLVRPVEDDRGSDDESEGEAGAEVEAALVRVLSAARLSKESQESQPDDGESSSGEGSCSSEGEQPPAPLPEGSQASPPERRRSSKVYLDVDPPVGGEAGRPAPAADDALDDLIDALKGGGELGGELAARAEPVASSQAGGSLAQRQTLDLPLGACTVRSAGPVSGPAVLCLHGLSLNADCFAGLASFLARLGYRAHALDFYGRGGSPLPRTPCDDKLLVGQCVEALRALRVASCCVEARRKRREYDAWIWIPRMGSAHLHLPGRVGPAELSAK